MLNRLMLCTWSLFALPSAQVHYMLIPGLIHDATAALQVSGDRRERMMGFPSSISSKIAGKGDYLPLTGSGVMLARKHDIVNIP